MVQASRLSCAAETAAPQMPKSFFPRPLACRIVEEECGTRQTQSLYHSRWSTTMRTFEFRRELMPTRIVWMSDGWSLPSGSGFENGPHRQCLNKTRARWGDRLCGSTLKSPRYDAPLASTNCTRTEPVPASIWIVRAKPSISSSGTSSGTRRRRGIGPGVGVGKLHLEECAREFGGAVAHTPVAYNVVLPVLGIVTRADGMHFGRLQLP